MDVLQPFVPLGNSGLVPRGQRYESTLVCLSFKCLFNQAGSGCGALVRGKQTPPPEPAAPAAAPEGLANCFWVTRAESLKQHQISKTCRQNTSKHNSNEFGFLHWHICRSLIFRFAILALSGAAIPPAAGIAWLLCCVTRKNEWAVQRQRDRTCGINIKNRNILNRSQTPVTRPSTQTPANN